MKISNAVADVTLMVNGPTRANAVVDVTSP